MAGKQPKIVAIVGPTASGKSQLAIDIAKQHEGEVISADSRQVYRGLDIGTGKLTQAEMDGIPHHLIDVADPATVYTAADFTRDATHAIEAIVARQHLPIIAGGTFFYLDILRGRTVTAPVAPNPALRSTLEKESAPALYDRLKQMDPARAETIDAQNRRRLIRALEIVDTLGQSPEPVPTTSPYDWCVIGLQTDRDMLRSKFAARIESWLQRGFVSEVTGLLESGITRSRLQELGFEYTLLLDFIDKKITRDELVDRFVQKNWQYAKRQLTWLKRDEEITWIPANDPEQAEQLVEQFLHQHKS